MPFDFCERRLTGEQQQLDAEFLVPTVIDMSNGSTGYVSEEAYWADLEGKLWIDGSAPAWIDPNTTGMLNSEELVRVIRTPLGYLLDVSHFGYIGNGAETNQVVRQAALDTNVNIEAVPIIGWISNPAELELVSEILLEQFNIILEQSYLEPVEKP